MIADLESPYPAFLRLAGRRVVVVGGGPVAASKLAGLLAAGADITVIAPAVCDAIRARSTVVAIHERGFIEEDLDGAWWVVAAATPAVNREVARVAEQRRVFVNAVDDRAAATAFLGGVVRRGEVTVAISTGGAAPALAGLIREALDAVIPDDVAAWATVAARARPHWQAAGIPLAERRPLLAQAINQLYGAK